MTPELLILLFMISPILGLVIYLLILNNQVKYDGNRYMFFKVRDNLIMLVAKGFLREEDFLFQEYYKITNRVINSTHTFTLKNLVKDLTRLDKDKLSKIKFIEETEIELNKKDTEVTNVINGFYLTIVAVLYRNSLIIRITVNSILPILSTYLHLNRFIKSLSSHFQNRYVNGIRLVRSSQSTLNHISA